MEDQKRKLPIINIAGTEFYVDAVNMELTDTKDPENIIHSMDMLILDDHLEMLFDKRTRNVKSGDWSEGDNARYEYIWLRHFEFYDIEGARIRSGQGGRLYPENLVPIELEGTKFYWDRENKRLMDQDNPYNQVQKNDMVLKDGKMGFYFDGQRKLVPFPHELERLKSNHRLPPYIRFVTAEEIIKKIADVKCTISSEPQKSKGRKLR